MICFFVLEKATELEMWKKNQTRSIKTLEWLKIKALNTLEIFLITEGVKY